MGCLAEGGPEGADEVRLGDVRDPIRPRGPAMRATSSSQRVRRAAVAPHQARVHSFDHFVPHVSTVPANAGEDVELYLRERVRPGIQGRSRQKPPRAVLFIPGSATASVPAFDLTFQDYSWMAFLARRGLDAFALDLTGYGRSPRPRMDDPCNVGPRTQQALLVPNPLTSTCAPSYPFLRVSGRLSGSRSA